jgi:phosphatidate cytidylyltransferase
MIDSGSAGRRRILSAVVFLPCFFVLVRYLPPAAFFVFVGGGILLAEYEYYRFHFTGRWSGSIGTGLALGMLVTATFAFPDRIPIPALITFIIATILLSQLVAGRDTRYALQDSAILAFGVFYIAWLLSHLISIRQFNEGILLVFFLFLVTWANDIAAYYSGRRWGRHPMAPIVSPKKTWEGAAGGLLGSLAGAFACHAWFIPSLSTADALWLGLLLGIAGPLGDLCESMLKRSAGVKDSGSLIPGHGGILDRIDSLIFTTPAFYYYLLSIHTP